MRTSTLRIRAVCLAVSASLPLTARAQPTAMSEQQAHEIGVEAYIYLYPLITMEITRRVATNVPPGIAPGAGPMNAFHHLRTYPTAEFRGVVRPNFDTLYSSAWLDLTREPMIVSAPDTGGRYYLLPVMDMWTDVLASPGKRTSDTTAQTLAIVPRCWKGSLPKDVQRIESPTSYVWIIGRTQTNGPKDYEAVHKVQDRFAITPVSQWGKKGATAAKFVSDPTVDLTTPPMRQVNAMGAAQYFALGAELMKANPPHATDWSKSCA